MNTKIMRIIALICATVMILTCFAACEIDNEAADGDNDTKAEVKTDEKDEETTVSEAETEKKTEATTEETTEEPTEAPTEEKLDNVYTIMVVDENGDPLANVPVQVCLGDVCLIPVPTNADGIVEKVLDEAPSEFTVKIPDARYVGEEYYTFPEDSKVLIITVTVSE